ncbi:MAG: hypothetical protein A3A16_02715 [Candidatus Harrisonbacteria bacterium RIFCSPLOWO2_01_FULL_44_18]|uniref:Lipid-A-disaccharide synthase n=1 Tax=Candidatus Harrisonbacteria bacterium RIFCSPLOWO2_01_FULL_44_18 TaxID=1798407 RepID=A0A1G1ZLE2_9BACT|nr:MAG: hypothetical protein A3A16_02715 [Candidatus Harrisonbacteria bacterium RIFCSPLOWO2_01_FULL_44_18]
MNRKAVLIARDFAPSGCFKRLEPILKERGFDVDLFIGEGKPLIKTAEEIALAASHASVVILGMSSSLELAQPEIAAGEATRTAGVPYGFYGDVPRCWARARNGAWFEKLAPATAFYFGVTQADADVAHEVFPNARLVGTGNPLREEMAFPRFTRDEVRSKLGVAIDEKIVLAAGGGGQFGVGNMASWTIVMEALSLLRAKGQRFQLILATHPGDRTPYAIDAATQKEMKLYDKLIFFSPVPARIVGREVLTTSDMVPGADIIVEFGGSIGIEGAYQNVPVVSLGFEVLFRILERISGNRVLEAVGSGLSELVVADASKLADKIRILLTADGFVQMRARQQELCPRPTERGAALRKMADVIEQIIGTSA